MIYSKLKMISLVSAVALLSATGAFAKMSPAGTGDIRAEVEGLYCNFCAAGTVTALKRIPGITGVDVDLKNYQLLIKRDNSVDVDLDAVVDVLGKSSYKFIGFK